MHGLSRAAFTVAVVVGLIAAAVAPAHADVQHDGVHSLTNQIRQSSGVAELRRDATLDSVAQEWANEMARTSTMVHSTNEWRAARIPAGWTTNGENIAYGFATANAVMDAWMASDGHRANILRSSFTRMGVGYNASGNYWVQIFAGYPNDELSTFTTAPVPSILGVPRVGSSLTASVGQWDTGVELTYQWNADGAPINTATGTTLAVTPLMVGSAITFTVSGSKAGYRTAARTSATSSQVLTNLSISRISGPDRFTVATAVSRAAYPNGAGTVFIATGSNYPDALSAGPAAISLGAPLLLVQRDSLPEPVATEIRRLNPSRIVIVGGEGSVSASVQAELGLLASTVERLGGRDRYEVSRTIAEFAFGSAGSAQAYVSNGNNFPDALSAGSPAGAARTPVLLVNGGAMTADVATVTQINSLGVSRVKIAGGTASVSSGIESDLRSEGSTVTRLAGPDRYAASIAINAEAFQSSSTAFLATGANFPDALAGSVLAASRTAPLFVIPTTCVPRGVLAQFARMGVTNVVVLGGTNSIDSRAGAMVPCGW